MAGVDRPERFRTFSAETFSLVRGTPAPAARSAAALCPLPCLNSNNYNEPGTSSRSKQTPYHARLAFALYQNAQAFISRYGLVKCGFLTLTFAENVQDMKEAQRRLRSVANGVLRFRYRAWIIVVERMKSGRVHYHLVVALNEDIRTGFNFKAAERRDYSSANEALRTEWGFWRGTALKYGFGRTELLPISSNAEGCGRYLGKYIGKHTGQRRASDKGARMVRYSAGARDCSVRFVFNSPGAFEWRQRLAAFASHYGIKDYEELTRRLGPRWGYKCRKMILAQPILVRRSSPAEVGRLYAKHVLNGWKPVKRTRSF